MKFSGAALAAAFVISFASSSSEVSAFSSPAFVKRSGSSSSSSSSSLFAPSVPTFQSKASAAARSSSSLLTMGYSVGIVGATGAVGKEIKQVLETRNKLPVDQLRIFGSARSAGTKIDTKYGEVTVELFDVAKARECDVVFLAVSGDFSLEHAEALCAGEDGTVVIDNSVR
jgi:hypothetical protein